MFDDEPPPSTLVMNNIYLLPSKHTTLVEPDVCVCVCGVCVWVCLCGTFACAE